MQNNLYVLLVDKTKTPEFEIERLSRFRGLKYIAEEKDINTFLVKYFSKDSVSNQEAFYNGHDQKWAKCFASHNSLCGGYIDPVYLEPFIARYVNAINSIGIKTFSSCDGWHNKPNKNKMFIAFKERYSKIWHKIIFSIIENTYGIVWSYNRFEAFINLPTSDKIKIKIYTAINKIAEIIENNRKQLCELKRNTVELLKGKNNLDVVTLCKFP